MSTAYAPPDRTGTAGPGRNEMFLFWASFITLIAAGMGFAIRGDIIANWGKDFGFTQTELGELTGMGLAGFGVAIIFFSFFTDLFGYGKLMVVAFLLHLAAVLTTLAAPYVFQSSGKSGAYWCLFVGQFLFSLGNGTCEAVINPLTATLFPRNKTHWLNILHAGWPGGLVLGALVSLVLNQVAGGVGWQIRWGIVLLPVLLYGGLMLGRRFPTSEAKASGVSVGTMAVTLLSPILLFLFLMHALVGYVELGTDSWITNITTEVLKSGTNAQLAFVWTNLLMFTLRFFAGPIVHRINPVGLLLASALLGTAGLAMLGLPFTDSVWPWIAAVTVYGVGKTFYWPTLLGVISERFPKGGALALGISGGIGMISAGLLGGPGIGYKQDYFAVQKIKQTSTEAYDRYKAPKESGFPLFTAVIPDQLPMVAGLDNAKLKVFDDWGTVINEDGTRKPDAKTTLETDLATIERLEKEGKPVGAELKKDLTGLKEWWDTKGQPNYAADKDKLMEARLFGAKQALLYTAAVPAALAIGYLLLILFFAVTGGYKQVHLDEEPPMGEY